jgi:ribosome-binding protein aMBF1 (putative translation factor)
LRLCEVCGTKEDFEKQEDEMIQAVTLHVCESCREDRKFHTLGDWAF